MTGGARGYSWRDAWPGNDLALKHGAHSEALIAPVAESIVATATETVPFLAEASYQPALTAWARSEARCLLLARYLEENGLLDERGRPRPAAELALKLERQASEHRDRLGLTPTARARLERDLGGAARDRVDIAAELAEARRIRESAEARMSAEKRSA